MHVSATSQISPNGESHMAALCSRSCLLASQASLSHADEKLDCECSASATELPFAAVRSTNGLLSAVCAGTAAESRG